MSYIVGLGIEFAWAQWKHEEIQEGYLVSGIIIPLIIPITTPLWMLALAVAFAVIFCKEIFGGTGNDIFNVAVGARMFLFFSYPTAMSGDKVWIAKESIFGLGNTLEVDALTAATPLGQLAQKVTPDASLFDMVCGFIPGSVGETSVIAIAIGAVILLWTGIAFLENDGQRVCRRNYRRMENVSGYNSAGKHAAHRFPRSDTSPQKDYGTDGNGNHRCLTDRTGNKSTHHIEKTRIRCDLLRQLTPVVWQR